MNALNLTLKRQFSGDLNDISATVLHQVKASNNNPQILAQWATKMINNISLFNADIRDGLDENWRSIVGLGPAYTNSARGPRPELKSQTSRWKRAAIFPEAKSAKKPTIIITKIKTSGEPT